MSRKLEISCECKWIGRGKFEIWKQVSTQKQLQVCPVGHMTYTQAPVVYERKFSYFISLSRWKLGHFRVLLCLCFKTSLSAKPFYENETAGGTHCHKKGFALRLVLKQRHKRTRKWPITPITNIDMKLNLSELTSVSYFYYNSFKNLLTN